MQALIRIGSIATFILCTACGGGGSDSSYSGQWQITLTPDPSYESSAPRCIKNAQVINEVVTIEESGTATIVKFDTGDVLMDAGEAFSGRIESDGMISGQVNAVVNCPRGYRAEIVQSLVFACPPGDTCSEVRRVLFNECPRYDTNGANDEIKDSPRCINLWRGTAEKISGEAE